MNEQPSSVLSVDQGRPQILGHPVFQGSMPDLLNHVNTLLREKEPQLIVTANVDHIIDLEQGTELVDAYAKASIRVIDGFPVLRTLRAFGATNTYRITGADLMNSLPESAAQSGWRIALTGGSDEALEDAAANLKNSFPAVEIFSVHMPFLRSATDPAGKAAVSQLQVIKPDITFICLGAPKQESWFLHWKDELPQGLYIGAGAAVDFAAGRKKRAPIFMQRAGLEWTWRLGQEFRRLAPRYLLKGPRFIMIASKLAYQQKTRRPSR